MDHHNDLQDPLAQTWAPLTVELAAITHPGHVRERNEDSYLLMRFGRSLEKLATNLDEQSVEQNYDLTGHGMLVADGMGGMPAGEMASRVALSTLIELIIESSDWTLA